MSDNFDSKQSMAIITEMIERSRTRRYLGDGNILLMWGYLTVGVSALVWGLLAITHNPAVNWLWFLIWIIGGTATPVMARKQRDKTGVTTYADRICNSIWSAVGFSTLVLVALCLGFLFIGGKDCWRAMFVLAFLIVGFAESMQGVVIREKSLVAGGAVGTLAGLFTLCCVAGGIPLAASWYMPVIILSFAAMMIVPGHILNYKSRRER